MATQSIHIEPKLGEGIYLSGDVSKILGINREKTYRWIAGYWGLKGGLDENIKYTFGEVGNRAINFYSLIEFYTFFRLRELGVSSHQIKDIHKKLSSSLRTPYPFAKVQDLRIELRKNKLGLVKKKFAYYGDTGYLIKLDGKQQTIFNGFIDKFLEKIEFDDTTNLASRLYPLENSKNVVVDPKHQFGQPVVNGTNIKTTTIYDLSLGGENDDFIARLYDLTKDQVKDAIRFNEKLPKAA